MFTPYLPEKHDKQLYLIQTSPKSEKLLKLFLVYKGTELPLRKKHRNSNRIQNQSPTSKKITLKDIALESSQNRTCSSQDCSLPSPLPEIRIKILLLDGI